MQVGDPGRGVALPHAHLVAQAPSAKPQAPAFSVPMGAQPPSAKPKAAALFVPLEAQPPFPKPEATASGMKKADADKAAAQPWPAQLHAALQSIKDVDAQHAAQVAATDRILQMVDQLTAQGRLPDAPKVQ